MLSVLFLWGCATTPQGSALTQDGVIHVTTGEGGPSSSSPMSLQDRVRQVFLESQAELVECYLPALERDAMRYGEIVVGVTLAASGSVTKSELVFSTITDEAMVGCVLEKAMDFEFPSHNREEIRASYPFLFTSDATPPEVVRALKVRHGLLPPNPIVNEEEEREPARGQEGWYETW